MAVFQYKGINSRGQESKGTINAEALPQAKQKIKASGILLTEISEQKSGAKQEKKTGITFGKKVTVTDLSLMTRQLATLSRAKIPVVQSLTALVDQTQNPYLKIVLAEIKEKVNEGSSLAKAFNDYPKVFNHVYVNMVEAGESSGTLEIVLLKLADFTEAQVKLKSKIKGAMTYPMIMVVFGALMMGLIFAFIIPKIAKIFVSMKKELPWTTQLSIGISDFIINYWYLVIIGGFSLVYLFKKYINSKKGRSRWDALLLKLPIIGELVMMINVSRFSSTLSTLLTSGVPILASMKIVINLISNVHMKAAISESREGVSEGKPLVGPLISSGLFPPMVTHMISLGEKSGELEPMLKIVSENYEDQVESKLNGLTSILEPVMMLGMGIAVAFIVFSVVMPLMDLNKIN